MIFDDQYVNCSVIFDSNYGEIYIKGYVKNPSVYRQMMLISPNPIDRMTNYSGSGLPFPCSEIAFENTPNKHLISNDGNFNVIFAYPNSFYASNGIDKIISPIYFILYLPGSDINISKFELPDLCVLRTLTYRSARKGPEFYAAKDYILPIANAETVMREYARAKIEHDIA
jgi:hypothetical protein